VARGRQHAAVSTSRTIVIAGAGIGGLTAALALARGGFRVAILEAAPQLEEVGAGIQLSPNATRVLNAFGLRERLMQHAVVPDAVCIRGGRSGREIARIPLGAEAEARYGSPYWTIHRGDLQRVLLDAAAAYPQIALKLGVSVAGHAEQNDGVTVAGRAGAIIIQEHGAALIGADGLWSAVRRGLGHTAVPRFRAQAAWRAVPPLEALAAGWGHPATTLWLGPHAHLVHYPVKRGRAVNIVAIVRDRTELRGWNEPGSAGELLAHFSGWAPSLRELLQTCRSWQKWSLFDLPPLPHWGAGPVTLLGDAAHAMLPFAAQGGAMAIEDAWTLAREAARSPHDLAAAFRTYEGARQARTARVARAAVRRGRLYHLAGIRAMLRNRAMRALGGERLRARQDWIYDWQGS
jgi:salicylate hydroxylase